MSAKRDRTFTGKARKALLLRQITQNEYVRLVTYHGDLFIGWGNTLIRHSKSGRQTHVRTLQTGSC